ncbi:hypothetical protein M2360_000464 [Rhizobium sp. SG_E_25_P2]|uniref:hypothetical protein n=1 Tax=Rhizobium sp. SG_E_25_P2 TaxID=2879942 RepID=UPI002472F84A|nr:hypothetical protein [Rhizobium sp. SG_E_25_P2]MDH6265083.1 hypothetical protein [Rhizobium sp. SG_E_25_P2]
MMAALGRGDRMIRPPRADGPYRDRDLDCQEALEALFLDQVRKAETAFRDLMPIRSRLMSEGLSAGWDQQDLESAIDELVRCYAMKVPPVKR